MSRGIVDCRVVCRAGVRKVPDSHGKMIDDQGQAKWRDGNGKFRSKACVVTQDKIQSQVQGGQLSRNIVAMRRTCAVAHTQSNEPSGSESRIVCPRQPAK